MNGYTWFAPAVFSGLCLLTAPVVLAVAWFVWLAAHRPRSDDWRGEGNVRPRRWRR